MFTDQTHRRTMDEVAKLNKGMITNAKISFDTSKMDSFSTNSKSHE